MSRRFLLSALLGVALLGLPAGAATITIVPTDAAGEGFNDPTAVAPVTGNSGTTRGQQRLNAFQAAANAWGALLQSNIEIRVEAAMNPLTCSAFSAILGSAGPNWFERDFPSAPRAGTWYAIALANSLAGTDLDPGFNDIAAEFNSTLDSGTCLGGTTWWYGVGGTVPAGTVDFYGTVLHELCHGLGFLTLVDLNSGAKSLGFDDSFMTFLEDHSLGLTWPNMSNAQRAASAKDNGDLHWVGSNVTSRSLSDLTSGTHPSGHVKMYAPNPIQGGSSVSHWDTTLVPNELMEPIANTGMQDIVSRYALRDTGWFLQLGGGTCTPGTNTLCLNNRFKVEVDWSTVQGGGQAGKATAVPAAPIGFADGGIFWFFSAKNPEMLVKVLNGCGDNNHYWVFTSAGTNVALTTRVTDTSTGLMKTYTNPDVTPAQPVQDVFAFATCP